MGTWSDSPNNDSDSGGDDSKPNNPKKRGSPQKEKNQPKKNKKYTLKKGKESPCDIRSMFNIIDLARTDHGKNINLGTNDQGGNEKGG